MAFIDKDVNRVVSKICYTSRRTEKGLCWPGTDIVSSLGHWWTYQDIELAATITEGIHLHLRKNVPNPNHPSWMDMLHSTHLREVDASPLPIMQMSQHQRFWWVKCCVFNSSFVPFQNYRVWIPPFLSPSLFPSHFSALWYVHSTPKRHRLNSFPQATMMREKDGLNDPPQDMVDAMCFLRNGWVGDVKRVQSIYGLGFRFR